MFEVTVILSSIPPGGGIQGHPTVIVPELAEVFSSSIKNKYVTPAVKFTELVEVEKMSSTYVQPVEPQAPDL